MPLLVPRYLSTSSPAFAVGLLALGLLLGLLAYNLFLAFSTRERMFAYFSVIVGLLVILQTFSAYERFIFYLTYNRVTVITHLLFITFLLFFEDFFSLRTHKPGLSKFNRISIYLIAGYTVFFLGVKFIFPDAAGFHKILDFIRELFVFYTNALFLFTIITALTWMRTEALLLLIAFIPPALLTSINAMNIFPFMARYEGFVGFLMQYNQPIGLSLQAILFSLAMGNRYNRIKLERQESREENKRLSRLNEERMEFYTNMSHELRTPLTIILGINEQLRAGKYGDSIRKNAAQFSAIERNCLRLLRQVSAMLRLGQPAETIRAETLPLAATIQLILNDFAPAAAERNIALSCLPHQAMGTVGLSITCEDLEALIMNLVANALKYCPSGSQVNLEAAKTNGGGLEVSVSDTGPGFSQEQQEIVFQRYRRGPTTEARFASGLGLPLVKTIMENYGGSVCLDSRPGKGSRFTLRFPAALVKTLASGTPEKPDRKIFSQLYTADLNTGLSGDESEKAEHVLDQKPRVLIVEDNQDMRTYIASVLAERFTVLSASSGEAALALLESESVDVIVSDVMMQGMDGHELLARMRATRGDFPIPLIFLTARHSCEEKVESLKEGAIRY
ncbi:MAG: response regulator, partial [Spirochaetia bacterium]|nr:response regulator [Spirochaetia bacterium]